MISQDGRDFSIAPIKTGDVLKFDLVYGDLRVPFSGQRILSKEQMASSSFWRIMNSGQTFHLTAWMRNGSIKSSRFTGVSGEQAFAMMQDKCGLELPNVATEDFADAEKMAMAETRLAIWALRRLSGEPTVISQIPSHLSREDRDAIKRFQRSIEREPNGNLDRDTFDAVLSASGIVVAPQFSDALDYTQKVAAAKLNQSWGRIDKDGRWQTQPIFQSAFAARSTAIPFRQGGRWVAIGADGKRTSRFVVDHIESCAENWCIIRSGKGYKLASLAGLKPPAQVFDAISSFSNGIAFGRVGTRWVTISEFGEEQPWASGYHNVKNHWAKRVAVQRSKGGKWQFATLEGEVLGDLQVDEIWPASDGLAAFENDGKFGFASARDGTIQISPVFEAAKSFSSGLAPAKRGGNWGYIDKNGRWAIEPKYSKANEFSQALAIVTDKRGRAGVINTSGEEVLAPQFEEIRNFSENRAAFRINGVWGYLDRRKIVATRPK